MTNETKLPLTLSEPDAEGWCCHRLAFDDDPGFLIRVRPDAYRNSEGEPIVMNYEAYAVVGIETDEDPTLWYEKRDPQPGEENSTDNLSQAEPFMTGHIKWDGCSNNNFREYTHECSRRGMTRLGDLFTRLFDLALQFMPSNAEYLS